MEGEAITGRGMSRRQNTLVVGVPLAALLLGLVVFVVHSLTMAAVTIAVGVGIGALLARGRHVVVDQEGGTVGGRRATHRELDQLVLVHNARELRGALHVLGRWRGEGAPPSVTQAAALGSARVPDDDLLELQLEAWALFDRGGAEGAPGPTYYATIEGTEARLSRRRDRAASYAVPMQLRLPAHGRAYLELTPEAAMRLVG
jgi:hypothetical protein